MVTGASPLPPADLARRDIPIDTLPAETALHRIHRLQHSALWFGPAPGEPPQGRFDAAGGEYGVCYTGLSTAAAFAEALLRRPGLQLLALEDLAARCWTTFTLARPLRAVPLYSPFTHRMGATGAISAGDYATARAWALALWRLDVAADGVLYRARHDNDERCLAIFDRARDALVPAAPVPMLDDPALLRALCARYDVGLEPA